MQEQPCPWCGGPAVKNSYCSDECSLEEEHFIADELEGQQTVIYPCSSKVLKPINRPDTKIAFLSKSFNWNEEAGKSYQRLLMRSMKINSTNNQDIDVVDVQAIIEKVRQENLSWKIF